MTISVAVKGACPPNADPSKQQPGLVDVLPDPANP